MIDWFRRAVQAADSAVYEAFNDGDGRTGRVLTRVAHWAPWAIAALAALCTADYLGIASMDWVILAALVGVMVSHMHQEATRLCVHCMSEVPANASERAHALRLLLRLRHPSRRTRLVLAALYLGLIAVWFATGVKFVFILATVLMIADMSAAWWHHRLRPWCPWCRNWGEGGDIHEPSPEPTVGAQR